MAKLSKFRGVWILGPKSDIQQTVLCGKPFNCNSVYLLWCTGWEFWSQTQDYVMSKIQITVFLLILVLESNGAWRQGSQVVRVPSGLQIPILRLQVLHPTLTTVI